MPSPRDSAAAMIRDLPEDATYDDIQYHLWVQQVIEDRLAAVDRGEVVSHEEVKAQLAKWRMR
jgi:predicted transcriptional regulator